MGRPAAPSPAHKSEGPGAPSAGFDIVIETRATSPFIEPACLLLLTILENISGILAL
jgi:hypothetical protein